MRLPFVLFIALPILGPDWKPLPVPGEAMERPVAFGVAPAPWLL
jgi:hypothetical protein